MVELDIQRMEAVIIEMTRKSAPTHTGFLSGAIHDPDWHRDERIKNCLDALPVEKRHALIRKVNEELAKLSAP